MQVRRYIVEDIPTIVELIRKFVVEAPAYKDIEFDPAPITWTLETNLNNLMLFCNVVVVNGQVVGCMGARLFNYAFSSQLFAQDLYLYIDSKSETRGAVRLLNHDYLEWARNRKVHAVRMSFSHGDMETEQAFKRLAEGLGYTPIGYIWEMKP